MKLKTVLLAVAVQLVTIVAFSQETGAGQKDNLLFLLRQTEHIEQALKTIDILQHKQNSTLKTGKVVIIIC